MTTEAFSHPSARTRGFTLIELLTVIAIIGILAAILIPVVGKVRESGKRAHCGSNVRQIALAILSYESEMGILPGPTEREIRSPLLGDDRPHATLAKELWPTENVDMSVILEDYLLGGGKYHEGEVGPFVCLSNQENALKDSRVPVYLLMRNIQTNPRSFFGDTDDGIDEGPKRLSQIVAAGTGPISREATELTQIWMVSDIDRGNTQAYGGDPVVDLDPAHDGGRNYAFFDAHVEYVKPGPNGLWRYPASTGDAGNHGN